MDEGGIQIGATNEEVGFDDATTPEAMAREALEAKGQGFGAIKVKLERSGNRPPQILEVRQGNS